MARVLCIANQKGGIGKTTTAVNLSSALALHGQRVLLVDLDPQADGTKRCGIDPEDLACSVYQLLLGLRAFKDVVRRCERGGFDVLPANRELFGAEIERISVRERDQRLRKSLAPEMTNYDYVFVDCPPDRSMLTLNALCAADEVIVPLSCGFTALEGLADFVGAIRRVHDERNPGLRVISVLRVMFDPRSPLQQQISARLKKRFGEKVFNTIVPYSVRLAEASGFGRSGESCDDRASKGAEAYMALAGELVSGTESR